MSIKKGMIITASNINDLKNQVIEIYSKRSFLSEAGYNKTTLTSDSPGFGDTPIKTGNNINQNFYYSLNALLQLNDIQNITVSNTTGDYIFKNSNETEDLITVVNNWNNIPKKTNTKPISCRGGCVGLCWNNCDGDCTYICVTGNDSNNGAYGGAWDGEGSTGDNCNGSCEGRCKDTCTNGCYHTCSTGCGTGCGNNCTGSCYRECGYKCTTKCVGNGDNIAKM